MGNDILRNGTLLCPADKTPLHFEVFGMMRVKRQVGDGYEYRAKYPKCGGVLRYQSTKGQAMTTITTEQALLPCPTCGEKKNTEILHTNYPGERFVVCSYQIGGCGTKTAAGDSDSEAMAKWNRRATTPDKIAPAVPDAQWISAETRQPEMTITDDSPCQLGGKAIPPAINSVRVLVALACGSVHVDQLTGLEGEPVWWETHGLRVTHWMPLPAAPQEGK